jgi:hypothetical protein
MQLGYFCDGCQQPVEEEERFHCTECTDFDLCAVCFQEQLNQHKHPITSFAVSTQLLARMTGEDEGEAKEADLFTDIETGSLFDDIDEVAQPSPEMALGVAEVGAGQLFADLVAHFDSLLPEPTGDLVEDLDPEEDEDDMIDVTHTGKIVEVTGKRRRVADASSVLSAHQLAASQHSPARKPVKVQVARKIAPAQVLRRQFPMPGPPRSPFARWRLEH